MADQNITNILAALGKRPASLRSPSKLIGVSSSAAQRPGGTPSQMPPQQMQGSAYQPQYGSGPPGAGPNYLPQPISSGSVDLSSIQPVSSGSVSIADAIAKARGFAAEKGVAYDTARGKRSTI